MMIIRTLAITAVAILFTSLVSAQDTANRITVMKSESCGCCNAWIDHLEDNGFEVEARNLSSGALSKFKADRGIAPGYKSCHTGVINGYVIEGHVPASDIKRLLAQKPEALGLSVPRMPIGSPGMEMGDKRDAYDILLMGDDGDAEVYSSFEAK